MFQGTPNQLRSDRRASRGDISHISVKLHPSWRGSRFSFVVSLRWELHEFTPQLSESVPPCRSPQKTLKFASSAREIGKKIGFLWKKEFSGLDRISWRARVVIQWSVGASERLGLYNCDVKCKLQFAPFPWLHFPRSRLHPMHSRGLLFLCNGASHCAAVLTRQVHVQREVVW